MRATQAKRIRREILRRHPDGLPKPELIGTQRINPTQQEKKRILQEGLK
jgi:hypothetical protein